MALAHQTRWSCLLFADTIGPRPVPIDISGGIVLAANKIVADVAVLGPVGPAGDDIGAMVSASSLG